MPSLAFKALLRILTSVAISPSPACRHPLPVKDGERRAGRAVGDSLSLFFSGRG
jgi:hypothetical protein